MAIELSSDRAICHRCGQMFGKRKGFFPVNYGAVYKGVGHLHICKNCVEEIYNTYLAQCNNVKDSVRQTCRKLDLFWSDDIFDKVEKKSTPKTVMTQYISRLNGTSYIGKSYDDTLLKEGTMWSFTTGVSAVTYSNGHSNAIVATEAVADDKPIPKRLINFWGDGYDREVYDTLEREYNYTKSRLPSDTEIDIGMEKLLKQVCLLEYDINRCTAEGKSTDKQINTLNTLLGSLNLKPTQKRQDELESMFGSTPMGVWIDKFEHYRPLPETPDELKKERGIMRYVFIWLGHVLEMLGRKNPYHDMYQEEMDRLKVEPPTYDGDDDEIVGTQDDEDDSGGESG